METEKKREIGGYLQLERFGGGFFHDRAYRFNLGRTCAVHFLKEQNCRQVFLPSFCCDSLRDALLGAGIPVSSYRIRPDFAPDEGSLPTALPEDAWLLVINFYGLLPDSVLLRLKERYDRVFVDFTHCFFSPPPAKLDSFASLRKFFGIPDGAYLLTEKAVSLPSERDRSSARFSHLFGRLEEGASAHYGEMLAVASSFAGAEPKRMSLLTEDLLRGIPFEEVRSIRERNFAVLHRLLSPYNELSVLFPGTVRGPLCYPFLCGSSGDLRTLLAKEGIFIPTYWKNVLLDPAGDPVAHRYAAHILALPVDQNCTAEDMEFIAAQLLSLIR